MATGVGSLQSPYHITRTYCSLARAPHTHPLVFVTAVSHMRAGPVVSATPWSSKLSTPRSHRHRNSPWRGTVCGRDLLAGNRKQSTATKRRRPTGMGAGPLQDPYHITRTYCSPACWPPTHLVIIVTAIAHVRAGPRVRVTVATDFIFSLNAYV